MKHPLPNPLGFELPKLPKLSTPTPPIHEGHEHCPHQRITPDMDGPATLDELVQQYSEIWLAFLNLAVTMSRLNQELAELQRKTK